MTVIPLLQHLKRKREEAKARRRNLRHNSHNSHSPAFGRSTPDPNDDIAAALAVLYEAMRTPVAGRRHDGAQR